MVLEFFKKIYLSPSTSKSINLVLNVLLNILVWSLSLHFVKIFVKIHHVINFKAVFSSKHNISTHNKK